MNGNAVERHVKLYFGNRKMEKMINDRKFS